MATEVHTLITAGTTVDQFRSAMAQHPDYRLGEIDNSGANALHYAARAGNVELIQFIGSCREGRIGVDTTTRYWSVRTPLGFAVQGAHVAATDALIRLGADVNAIQFNYDSAPRRGTLLDGILARPIEQLRGSDAMRLIANRLLLAGAQADEVRGENDGWRQDRVEEVRAAKQQIAQALPQLPALGRAPHDVLDLVTAFAALPPVDRTPAP